MDDDRRAFTVASPEARKYRTTRNISAVFFFLFWILSGVTLFGTTEIPKRPIFILAGIALALSLGFSTYGTRKQKELAPIINRRFAEAFTATPSMTTPKTWTS